ncbi:c-type cytochrome [Candidatus Foliamicus sp.]
MNCARHIGDRVAAVVATTMLAASAQADAAIEYRKDVMLSMAAHLSALTGLLAGELDFDQNHIEAQATSLGLNAQLVSTLFPPGSEAGETSALPGIWQRPEQFLARAEAAEREGRNLVAAAESGDREFMVQSLKRLADACRNCHREFRSEG